MLIQKEFVCHKRLRRQLSHKYPSILLQWFFAYMCVVILLYRNKVIRNLYNFINFSFQPIVNTWTSSIWYVAEINLFKLKKHTRKVFFLLIYAAKYNHARFSINHEGHATKVFFCGSHSLGQCSEPETDILTCIVCPSDQWRCISNNETSSREQCYPGCLSVQVIDNNADEP